MENVFGKKVRKYKQTSVMTVCHCTMHTFLSKMPWNLLMIYLILIVHNGDLSPQRTSFWGRKSNWCSLQQWLWCMGEWSLHVRVEQLTFKFAFYSLQIEKMTEGVALELYSFNWELEIMQHKHIKKREEEHGKWCFLVARTEKKCSFIFIYIFCWKIFALSFKDEVEYNPPQ